MASRSLSTIKTSFLRASHLVRRGIGRAFPRKQWPSLREVRRFRQQLQGVYDSSTIARTLVSAAAKGTGAQQVLLLLSLPPQAELHTVAALGVDEPWSLALQARSPLLIWLEGECRAVAAEEIYPLPQWQGLPPAEREALSALDCQLFVPMLAGGSVLALLVVGRKVGRKKRGASYTPQEIEGVEVLAHHAAASMEIAHLLQQLDKEREELRQAHRQVANSTRMATVGEVAFTLARDIESSLLALADTAHFMAQDGDAKGVSQQNIKALEAEAARARDALLPLLELARGGQSGWGVRDLNSLLSSVALPSELSAPMNGVAPVLRLDPAAPQVWCDEVEIKQVFVNLIANAVDAMPHGGLLTISTRASGAMVEVEFADTGAGVPPDHLERVFDPFFTTKAEGKGNGLGLAGCRRTVERHQGTIGVESQVGKGTTVTVVLPLQTTGQVPPNG